MSSTSQLRTTQKSIGLEKAGVPQEHSGTKLRLLAAGLPLNPSPALLSWRSEFGCVSRGNTDSHHGFKKGREMARRKSLPRVKKFWLPFLREERIPFGEIAGQPCLQYIFFVFYPFFWFSKLIFSRHVLFSFPWHNCHSLQSADFVINPIAHALPNVEYNQQLWRAEIFGSEMLGRGSLVVTLKARGVLWLYTGRPVQDTLDKIPIPFQWV